jgi:uncharacterized protein
MSTLSFRPTLNRIEAIDALRGFALAGIVLVHMVEQYLAAPAPEGVMEALVQGPLDNMVDGAIFLFFRGKFFALFSILFGLSFFMQMDRADQRGNDFKLRFIWRLVILLFIGYLHHLFYRGDILTIYAILGLFLVPFYRAPTGVTLAIAAVTFLGLPRFIIYGLYGAGPLFFPSELTPSSPEIIAYFEILKEGSMWDVFATNATQGHLMKADFQLGVFSRAYLTFGFFLVGLLLGRMRFFENFPQYKKHLKRVLIWSFVGILGLIGISLLLFFGQEQNGDAGLNSWTAMTGLTLYDLFNLLMTAIIVAAFMLIYMRVRGEKWLGGLAPYGRTALTNYFLQSVIGTAIFYGWGLGLIGEVRNIEAFLLAIIILVLQVVGSRWWLKRFRYGPFEWIWRVLTYGKVIPLTHPAKTHK